jgi:hypothetical protein
MKKIVTGIRDGFPVVRKKAALRMAGQPIKLKRTLSSSTARFDRRREYRDLFVCRTTRALRGRCALKVI